jgi:hypothetical protein
MASSNVRFWEGEEREKHIQLLLKRHYGPGNYQEVPAKHVGDFGIEGYSTDGCAYQCYATQEPCATQQRYDAQRDKITTDIGKFIKNKPELVKLFGGTLISRWILIVPVSESASLVQHASKKSEEVLRVRLPYVSDDFKVIVDTDSCFAKEMNELVNAGMIPVEGQAINVDSEDRDDWITSNDGLVGTLDQKAQKIPRLVTDGKIEDFKISMIEHYLRGQNLLDSFSQNYPDIYAQIDNCKHMYEFELRTLSLINSDPAPQHLKEAFKQYSEKLKDSAPNLPRAIIDTLGWEGVSDWLMRCPLDF